MNDTPDTLVVYCSCPPGEPARYLAARLVESGLAACVSRLDGITSTYRWQGEICHDDEALLVIKTCRAAYASLERLLTEIHPYELPEIIAVPITTGLPGYLDWVRDNSSAGQN